MSRGSCRSDEHADPILLATILLLVPRVVPRLLEPGQLHGFWQRNLSGVPEEIQLVGR